MYKTIRNAIEIFAITLVLSIIPFYGVDIDFVPYLEVAVTVFISMSICFFLWKSNQNFYFVYLTSALLNFGIFLFNKYQQGFWPCWDFTDKVYVVYSSLIVLFFIITIILSVLRKKNTNVNLPNYFSERKYDLERLYEYLQNYSVVGLESFWGDGKTYLYNLFRQEYLNEYFYISIGVMTLQVDTIERVIVAEINEIFKEQGIFSQASDKFNSTLKSSAPYGLGTLFTKNDSYTELFKTLIGDVEKLNKPILITFEDIDRITDKSLIYKTFSMTETLTSNTKKLKVLFQFDEDKLLNILEVKPIYLEKYIPYVVNLTSINFKRCLKVLLKNGKIEKKYENIKRDELYFLTQESSLDFYLEESWNVHKRFSLHLYFTIRSIELFLSELNGYLNKQEYSNNETIRKVVIMFFSIKHFMPEEYKKLSFEERFSESCNFEYENKKYSMTELNLLLNETEEVKRSELFDKIFTEKSENLNHLIFLHMFGYKFEPAENYQTGEKHIQSILNESTNNIEIKEHNEKIDRLIWNLLANGKSEFTDKENAVREFEKILDKRGKTRNEEYNKFLNTAFYEEFEKSDNSTVFLLGISNFLPIFQGFRIYEKNSIYWIKLIDFYFDIAEIKSINASLIHSLNYCDTSQREIFIHILDKFNHLKIDGNLNDTECYPKFLKEYIKAFERLGYIDVHMIEMYSFESKFLNAPYGHKYRNLSTLYMQLQLKLDKLKKETPLKEIKDEVTVMKNFLKHNAQLILNKNILKEYTSGISTSSTIKDSLEDTFAELDKLHKEKEELKNYLHDNYTSGKFSAYDVSRIWEKYFPEDKELEHE